MSTLRLQLAIFSSGYSGQSQYLVLVGRQSGSPWPLARRKAAAIGRGDLDKDHLTTTAQGISQRHFLDSFFRRAKKHLLISVRHFQTSIEPMVDRTPWDSSLPTGDVLVHSETQWKMMNAAWGIIRHWFWSKKRLEKQVDMLLKAGCKWGGGGGGGYFSCEPPVHVHIRRRSTSTVVHSMSVKRPETWHASTLHMSHHGEFPFLLRKDELVGPRARSFWACAGVWVARFKLVAFVSSLGFVGWPRVEEVLNDRSVAEYVVYILLNLGRGRWLPMTQTRENTEKVNRKRQTKKQQSVCWGVDRTWERVCTIMHMCCLLGRGDSPKRANRATMKLLALRNPRIDHLKSHVVLSYL